MRACRTAEELLAVMVMPPIAIPVGIRSVIAIMIGGIPLPVIIIRILIAIAAPIGKAIIIRVMMLVPPGVMRGLGRSSKRGGQKQAR